MKPFATPEEIVSKQSRFSMALSFIRTGDIEPLDNRGAGS
jgi:hypothetical protein